jgi:hypothetical protein
MLSLLIGAFCAKSTNVVLLNDNPSFRQMGYVTKCRVMAEIKFCQ